MNSQNTSKKDEKKILKGSSCIIINWKKPKKTSECLVSILKSNSLPDHIFIVDNNSQDESIKKIKNLVAKNISSNLDNYIEKKISYIALDQNKGFSGGNNEAIKKILEDSGIKYIWLLNNDAIVEKDALEELIKKSKTTLKTAVTGSCVLYENSDRLQCYGGGTHYGRLGLSFLLYKGKKISHLPKNRKQPDYIMGCSMLIHRNAILEIGLLDESFFMYSEEIDWQKRAKDKGWEINVAEKSKVYHGSIYERKSREKTYYYYKNRATILNAKKHYGVVWKYVAVIINLVIILIDKPSIENFRYAVLGIYHGAINKTGIFPTTTIHNSRH